MVSANRQESIERMNRREFMNGLLGVLSARRYSPAHKVFQATPFPIKFENVAAHAGLTTPTIFGGRTENKYILETTGCGAAFFDYDSDGWPDIFLVNGTTLDGKQSPPPSNRLLRNNHDGTFSDVTEKAGLVKTGWGQGVCI